MNEQPVRLAVIGAGNMGRHHARVAHELEQIELVAVCDPDEARAAEAAGSGARAYPSVEALLAREQVDAVCIAVPTLRHRDVGLECLRAGLHVLMEKPLAATSAEARELVAAAEASGLILAAGHVERFNPAVRALGELLRRGDLGRVTSLLARRVGLGPPRINDVNIVIDLAIHDLDVCVGLLGRLPSAIAATAGRARHPDRFDHAEIFLDFDGVGCFVQANWITPVRIRTLAVTGERTYAELDYVNQGLRLFRERRSRRARDFQDFVARYGTPLAETAEVERREPLAVELEAFAADVAAGRLSASMTGREGLAAVELAEAVLARLPPHEQALRPTGSL